MKEKGLKLLFLVGNPGNGKSECVKRRLDEARQRYIKASRLTAFQFYKQIFKHRNKAIILDDVEDALKRSDTARMLMALCETDEAARRVAWFGSEAMLKIVKGKKKIRIPQEFTTTSRVCVICNDWNILTSKFGALLDRGTVVFFDPEPAEIHRFVGEWYKDKSIYLFIGKHLDEIPQHSIRYYVHAKEQKRLGLDWKAVLLESWTNEQSTGTAAENLVRQLMADPKFKTDKERIEAFTAPPDGMSRRTWYARWRLTVQEAAQLPRRCGKLCDSKVMDQSCQLLPSLRKGRIDKRTADKKNARHVPKADLCCPRRRGNLAIVRCRSKRLGKAKRPFRKLPG